jgi:hypothetical protein
MARGRGRGGRSHGHRSRGHHHHHHFGRSRFGRSRFHSHHRYRGMRRGGYGYGGSQDAVALYEQQMDQVYNSALTPTFFNGTLTFYGRDTYVTNHLNTFQPEIMIPQFQQAPNLMQMFQQPIYQEMTIDQYFPNGVFPEQQQQVMEMQNNVTSYDGLPMQQQQPEPPKMHPMFEGLTFTP